MGGLSWAIVPHAGTARSLQQGIRPVHEFRAAQFLTMLTLEVLAVVEDVSRKAAAQELVPLVCR